MDAFFCKSGRTIIPLTVREDLEEQLARKLACRKVAGVHRHISGRAFRLHAHVRPKGVESSAFPPLDSGF
jgi:hypothetical protein